MRSTDSLARQRRANAQFDDDTVRALRRRHAGGGGESVMNLAIEKGVGYETMRRLLNGATYAWVPDTAPVVGGTWQGMSRAAPRAVPGEPEEPEGEVAASLARVRAAVGRG